MVNAGKYTSPMDFIGDIPLDWLVTVKIPSLKNNSSWTHEPMCWGDSYTNIYNLEIQLKH